MSLRVPLDDLREEERELPSEVARYLLRVHRLRTGDMCVAFDPQAGLEADLTVLATGRELARVRLSRLRASRHTALVPIVVVQGLPKGSKLEAIVRDATELGATRVIVAACERSVKRGVDLERCRRVAIDAARQCGRGDTPLVEGPVAFALAVGSVRADLAVLLDPRAERSLGQLIALEPRASLAVAIGPEGGLTDREEEAALEVGFVRARLGRFVLRTETACAAALGAFVAHDVAARA